MEYINNKPQRHVVYTNVGNNMVKFIFYPSKN